MIDRDPTPKATLRRSKEIAESEGLKHVYLGNVITKAAENTYCPGCGELLVERHSYAVLRNNIKEGCCPECDREIYGVWR
jgi:pyruvate formate lyase activating enzyme